MDEQNLEYIYRGTPHTNSIVLLGCGWLDWSSHKDKPKIIILLGCRCMAATATRITCPKKDLKEKLFQEKEKTKKK